MAVPPNFPCFVLSRSVFLFLFHKKSPLIIPLALATKSLIPFPVGFHLPPPVQLPEEFLFTLCCLPTTALSSSLAAPSISYAVGLFSIPSLSTLSLLWHLLYSLSHPTPPFCFPVSPIAEIKLTSVPNPCWYFRALEPDQFCRAASRGRGEVGHSCQREGSREAAQRAWWGGRQGGCMESGNAAPAQREMCSSIRPSPCCIPPAAKAVSKGQRVQRGDTCGRNAYVPAEAAQIGLHNFSSSTRNDFRIFCKDDFWKHLKCGTWSIFQLHETQTLSGERTVGNSFVHEHSI